MTAPRPRAHIADLPAYRPGRSAADAMADHGVADAIKLASNELSLGPLPAVRDAMASVRDPGRYPAHGAPSVVAAFAAVHGIASERVAVGAGSVGLLQQLALAYVGPGDEVVFGWPSFEAYPVFTDLVGGTSIPVPNTGMSLDADAIAAELAARGDAVRLVLVANPNNPTSTALPGDALDRIVDAACPDTLVVIDEAYREFVTDAAVPNAIGRYGDRANVAVLRTFSKAHGLAALRIGVLAADPAVIEAVGRVLVPFVVNTVAQVAAVASLGRLAEVEARCAEVIGERSRVVGALAQRGFRVPRSQANFVWLPVGAASTRLGHGLERVGVVTRVFDGVGVRVTVGAMGDNDRFLSAFDDVRRGPDGETIAAEWWT